MVAFPAGHEVDQRFRVRIEDRTGEADLDSAARSLGRLGIEVVAISNGAVFDNARTQLVVEPGYLGLEQLEAAFPGVEVNAVTTGLTPEAVILRLGPEWEAIISSWTDAS